MSGCYSISNIVPWTLQIFMKIRIATNFYELVCRKGISFLNVSSQRSTVLVSCDVAIVTIWLLLNEDASWNKQSVISRLFGADNRPADNQPKHYRCTSTHNRCSWCCLAPTNQATTFCKVRRACLFPRRSTCMERSSRCTQNCLQRGNF